MCLAKGSVLVQGRRRAVTGAAGLGLRLSVLWGPPPLAGMAAGKPLTRRFTAHGGGSGLLTGSASIWVFLPVPDCCWPRVGHGSRSLGRRPRSGRLDSLRVGVCAWRPRSTLCQVAWQRPRSGCGVTSHHVLGSVVDVRPKGVQLFGVGPLVAFRAGRTPDNSGDLWLPDEKRAQGGPCARLLHLREAVHGNNSVPTRRS